MPVRVPQLFLGLEQVVEEGLGPLEGLLRLFVGLWWWVVSCVCGGGGWNRSIHESTVPYLQQRPLQAHLRRPHVLL